ncbi:MAG: hypothetical protein IRZ04_15670 [Rhodospirillales bacterium]|nr:hypothetical protein [Rhodospirillales bacterium]
MRRLATIAAASLAVVLTSKSPYWKVGPLDPALSRACSLGRFNVADPSRWQAYFGGPEGAETLAIAKGTGANLIDPGRLAKPKEDYFFRKHGTTECEVYVGGRRG